MLTQHVKRKTFNMLGLDWRHNPTYRLSLGVLSRRWNVTVSEWSNTDQTCVSVGHNCVTSSLKLFPSSLSLSFPHGNYTYTSR